MLHTHLIRIGRRVSGLGLGLRSLCSRRCATLCGLLNEELVLSLLLKGQLLFSLRFLFRQALLLLL